MSSFLSKLLVTSIYFYFFKIIMPSCCPDESDLTPTIMHSASKKPLQFTWSWLVSKATVTIVTKVSYLSDSALLMSLEQKVFQETPLNLVHNSIVQETFSGVGEGRMNTFSLGNKHLFFNGENETPLHFC